MSPSPQSPSPLRITMELNGEARAVVVEPRATLLEALRDRCGLHGAAAGCADGSCGSCTVLVGGEPVRACMMLAVQAHGTQVRTVEGLAAGDVLDTLQTAFVKAGAPQCGYCIPGFLMLAEGVLQGGGRLDDAAIDGIVAANECRCGAYGPIRAAIADALAERLGADA